MNEELDHHILTLYKPIKKIGSGAYGIVWKAQHRATREIKALKKNFDAFTNSTDAQRTYRQIMFLRQFNHENIIKLENIYRATNDKDIYLVFQHMDVDLHTLIRENTNDEHLQERHKQYIIYQIAKSLYYLHNSDIIHRDLKPSNVLINESCDAKLCDFGLVRSLHQTTDNELLIMTDYIATRWYRAPELLIGCKKYAKEIDIWALGCLIGELIRGKPMFPGTSTTNQIEKILAWTGTPTASQLGDFHANMNKQVLDLFSVRKKAHKSDFFPIKPNADCMDLICKTLEFNPQKRITIEQVLKHPYLSQFYRKSDINQIKKVALKLHIDDNVKLSLKNYRNLLYSQMRSGNNKSVCSKGRDGHALAEKNYSVHQNNHLQSQKTIVPCEEKHTKSTLTKDKTDKKLAKTFANENYHQFASRQETSCSANKKHAVYSESKSTANQNNSKASSLKKKGISLCSKDMKHSVYSEIMPQGYEHVKTECSKGKAHKYKPETKYHKYGIQEAKQSQSKERKISFGSVKNARKVVYTNITVNDNIGRFSRGS